MEELTVEETVENPLAAPDVSNTRRPSPKGTRGKLGRRRTSLSPDDNRGSRSGSSNSKRGKRSISRDHEGQSPTEHDHDAKATDFLFSLFFGEERIPKVEDLDITLSIVDFSAVIKTTLGLELSFEDVQELFTHINAGSPGILWRDAGAAAAGGVEAGLSLRWAVLLEWWMKPMIEEEEEEDDIPEGACLVPSAGTQLENSAAELRRLCRLAGIFRACRSALANISTEAGVTACKLLFNRIDNANLHEEMRLTTSNMQMLCSDLGIELSEEELTHAILEMDHANRTFVAYKSFEDWWRHGARHTGGNEAYNSAEVRSMLRISGLLSNDGNSIASVLDSAKSIISDTELLDDVEVALDSMAKNSDSDMGHVFDSMHTGDGSDKVLDVTTGLQGKSLGVFGADSPVRSCIDSTIRSPFFETFVLICIMINLIILVVFAEERRRDRTSELLVVLDWANNILGAMFTIEMGMRIVGYGFYQGQGSYLSDWWNRFDFIIIMIMWISFIASLFTEIDRTVSFTVTALRSFRALRFFKGTREIMNTIGLAASTINMIFIGILVAGLMFSIVGRELFGGSLTRTCDFNYETANGTAHETYHAEPSMGEVGQHDFEADNSHDRRQLSAVSYDWYTTVATTQCPNSFSCSDSCYEVKPMDGPKYREHHVDKYGFDTLAQATQTIFSITALDEWMHIANPIRESPSTMVIVAWPFFVLGVVLLGLLSVNLFLATVTFSYLELRQQSRQNTAIAEAHKTLVRALLGQRTGIKASNTLYTSKAAMLAAKAAAGEIEEEDLPELNGFRSFCYTMTHNKRGQRLDDFILVTVCANTLSMAAEHHGMDPGLKNFLYVLEVFFTCIYVSEAVMKIGGSSFKSYISKGINRLDFFIVCSALGGYGIEIALSMAGEESGASSAQATTSFRLVRLTRVLRAARAVRLGKLLFRSDTVRRTLSEAFASLDAVFNLIGMLMFVLFVVSVMGLHLFWHCHEKCQEAGDDHQDGEMGATCVYTRGHFGALPNAILANYQLFSRDNWASILFEYQECMDHKGVAVYFDMVFTILNFVLLPIFVSIFLDNFSLSDEQKRQKQVELYVKTTYQRSKGIINVLDIKYINNAVNVLYKSNKVLRRPVAGFVQIATKSKPKEEDAAADDDNDDNGQPSMLENITCGCFAVENPLRACARTVVESGIFTFIILTTIAASGISMAYEGPDASDHGPVIQTRLEVAEYTFYCIFLLECLMKILVCGFHTTREDSYMKSTSNVFDFTVVCVTTIDMLLRLLQINAQWVQAIRLMRTLRLVRLLEHVDGLSIMAQAIVKCLPSTAAIMVLLMSNIVMFSIIGMNMFMGEQWYCAENTKLGLAECTAAGLTWSNPTFHFDDIFSALRTLVVVSTRQGWYLIFYQVADSTSHELPPEQEANLITASTFFTIFILINGFMLEELFIGMLVEVFSQTSGTVLLTKTQKKWRYVKMYIFHLQKTMRPAPENPFARKCFDLVTLEWYKQAVNVLILIGIFVIAFNSKVYHEEIDYVYDYVNDAVLLLYTGHVFLFTMAYGGGAYIRQAWYDHVLIAVLWVVSVFAHLQHTDMIDSHTYGWIQSMQSLRVIWLIEVMTTWPQMRKLVHTIRLSVGQTINIGLLMFLVFFVFGIVAMKLYGHIDVDHPVVPLHALSHTTNFGDIVHSMQLLFQITTGHPLPYLVEDMYHAADVPIFVPFLFVFFVISNFVFLNLFVALLLENFEYIWEGEFAIEEVDVESFGRTWDKFVVGAGNLTLSIGELWNFVDGLQGAMSVVIHTDPFWHNRLLLELDLTNDDLALVEAEIEFHELLLALTRMRYGNSCLPFDEEVEAEKQLKAAHEESALKLMRVYVGAWRMMRYPPEEYTTEAEIKRYRAAVHLARLWAIGVVIKNSRLSKHKSWHAQHVEDTIRNHGRFAQLTQQVIDFFEEKKDEKGNYPNVDVRFPPILNEAERKHVHTIAEEHHLQHGSAGEGADRHVQVWRRGERVKDDGGGEVTTTE